jgi:hypothetical protein
MERVALAGMLQDRDCIEIDREENHAADGADEFLITMVFDAGVCDAFASRAEVVALRDALNRLLGE